jgi:hypothetical protein
MKTKKIDPAGTPQSVSSVIACRRCSSPRTIPTIAMRSTSGRII